MATRAQSAMKNAFLIYPTIIEEVTDTSGHYFAVSSPNIPGMHTDGSSLQEAVINAADAIATMLDGGQYPQPQDAAGWSVDQNQHIVYVTVDMDGWLTEKASVLSRNN